jgi:major vault protein
LFEGPGTYIPRKEVVVEETVRATVIRPNQAIRLRARKETIDRQGVARVTGEEWLVKKTGAYLPGAYEEVVDGDVGSWSFKQPFVTSDSFVIIIIFKV